MFTELSYEEMKEELEKWLNPEDNEADGTTTKSPITSAKTTTTSDIEDAFGELFNS